jgi:hypothetical protein
MAIFGRGLAVFVGYSKNFLKLLAFLANFCLYGLIDLESMAIYTQRLTTVSNNTETNMSNTFNARHLKTCHVLKWKITKRFWCKKHKFYLKGCSNERKENY